ncbi:MAG TPA: 3-dehydroquinate synthase, partial [Usitatibacteraceae bacterium]|nr:3-dehydroquinate synthase [Usitatibacteraceae bacterium]
ARLSARLRGLPQGDASRLEALVRRAGLPADPPKLPVDAWLDAMGRDKKNESGRITLILLDRLGAAAIEKDAPAGELEAFLSGR